MAQVRDTFELRIGGHPYVGWTEAEVSAALDSPCRTATLALSRPLDDGAPTRISVPPDSEAELWLRDETGSGRRDRVLRGWVCGLACGYSASGWHMSLTVYSRTVDVMHSDPTERFVFCDRTRTEIARALCAPHGVDVVLADGASDSARVPRFRTEASESVAVALDRLLAGGGLFATDDGDGQLVLATVGGAHAETAIVGGQEGANVLSCDANIDTTQRFSEYICRGQRAGDDRDAGAPPAEAYGSAVDAWQTRTRVLHIDPRRGLDDAQCLAHARFEAARRAGQSMRARYTVQGLRQRLSGAPWEPNLRVQIRDAWLGIDQEILIAAVTMRQTATAQTTELTVGPVEGYQRELTPETRRPRGPRRPPVSSGLYRDIADYMAAISGEAAR